MVWGCSFIWSLDWADVHDGALIEQVIDADCWLRAQGAFWPEALNQSVASPYGLAFSWCDSWAPRRDLPRVSVLRAEGGIWPVKGFIQNWHVVTFYFIGQSNAHLDFGKWGKEIPSLDNRESGPPCRRTYRMGGIKSSLLVKWLKTCHCHCCDCGPWWVGSTPGLGNSTRCRHGQKNLKKKWNGRYFCSLLWKI